MVTAEAPATDALAAISFSAVHRVNERRPHRAACGRTQKVWFRTENGPRRDGRVAPVPEFARQFGGIQETARSRPPLSDCRSLKFGGLIPRRALSRISTSPRTPTRHVRKWLYAPVVHPLQPLAMRSRESCGVSLRVPAKTNRNWRIFC